MPAITTNIDLMNAAARNKIPLVGVFFKDQLPKEVRPGGYIFNLQDSDQGEGTHWTAAWVEDGKVVYFDPFGIGPPENVKRFFWGMDKTMDYNKKVIQNIESFICGYYVLYFLWYMSRFCRFQEARNIHQRFKNFQRLWSEDAEDNRTLLEKYIRCLH
jgi:hypothetical protein